MTKRIIPAIIIHFHFCKYNVLLSYLLKYRYLLWPIPLKEEEEEKRRRRGGGGGGEGICCFVEPLLMIIYA
jgi:hypothetical protein